MPLTTTSHPWRVEFSKMHLHPVVMTQENGERICVASTCGTKTTRDKLSHGEKMANAHLIAAAPRMREMLKMVMGMVVDPNKPVKLFPNEIRMMREALKFANGESN